MSPRPRAGAARHAYGFALASFLAVGAGCFVAKFAGVGTGVMGRNAIAWVIGAAATTLAARTRPARLFPILPPLTLLALAISLFSSGQSGVHRWISTGPLTWNVAFLLLPAATVASAAALKSGSRWTWWFPLAIELELCFQPDASQATAFAAALVAAHWTAPSPPRVRFAASLFFALAAIFAWTRLDPLRPVPEVEGIIRLAATVSNSMAALCVILLAAVTASPLLALNHARAGVRPPALALFVYFAVCALMPLFGAFPVPIVGMGMSPIIGFWLGTAALMCDIANRQGTSSRIL